MPFIRAVSAGILVQSKAVLLKSYDWQEVAFVAASRFVSQLETRKEKIVVFYEEKEGLSTFLQVVSSAVKDVSIVKCTGMQKAAGTKHAAEPAVFFAPLVFRKSELFSKIYGLKRNYGLKKVYLAAGLYKKEYFLS